MKRPIIKAFICLLALLTFSHSANAIMRPPKIKQQNEFNELAPAVFHQETKKPKKKQLEKPEDIYKNIKPANVKLENSIDPYEQQDNYEYYRSPYPLIRTTQKIFSQNTALNPGYYLLSPRKIGAKTYMFFKQAGRVLYVVPVFDIESINIDDHYPQPKDPYDKFPWGVKHIWKFLNIMVGRYTAPIKVPEHKVECFQYNSNYYGINVYFKDKMYKTIYKLEKNDEYL